MKSLGEHLYIFCPENEKYWARSEKFWVWFLPEIGDRIEKISRLKRSHFEKNAYT